MAEPPRIPAVERPTDPIIEALAAMVRESVLAKRARRRRLRVVDGGKDR